MTNRSWISVALLAGALTTNVWAQSQTLEQEVRALHAAMVSTYKRDPVSVARFYTDDASIMGGGVRAVGREQVERYWRDGPGGAEWTLEVLEVGGEAASPWVRGRSTMARPSGQRMVTEYVGILKRGSDGQLRFYLDMFVGAPGKGVRQPAPP